ncbi:MAG: carbon-nitrogen hydrolase family protein [Candidatus Helarchaeota archaeon]|nr:carbon-nitrogen hydrolase family protein [Candidatus Helarchaeota archaeon]
MVKLGVLQLQVRKDEGNFEKIEELVNEAKKEKIEIVCLPEKWNAKGPLEPIENENGNIFKFLSKMAKNYKLYIIGGAILVKLEDNNYVISYIFDKNGNCIGAQRKIHLYSYENQYVTSGSELELINTDFGIIGVAICFDLNAFPEVGRAYALNGANIVFNPSMIPGGGIENWHIYLKARALENRMPVVGVNAVGGSPAGNLLTGESIIIGFHKGHESPAKLKIIKGEKNKEQLIFADLDLEYPQKLREKRLPHIKSFKIKKN